MSLFELYNLTQRDVPPPRSLQSHIITESIEKILERRGQREQARAWQLQISDPTDKYGYPYRDKSLVKRSRSKARSSNHYYTSSMEPDTSIKGYHYSDPYPKIDFDLVPDSNSQPQPQPDSESEPMRTHSAFEYELAPESEPHTHGNCDQQAQTDVGTPIGYSAIGGFVALTVANAVVNARWDRRRRNY